MVNVTDIVNATDIVNNPAANIPNTPEQVLVWFGIAFGIIFLMGIIYTIYQIFK